MFNILKISPTLKCVFFAIHVHFPRSTFFRKDVTLKNYYKSFKRQRWKNIYVKCERYINYYTRKDITEIHIIVVYIK